MSRGFRRAETKTEAVESKEEAAPVEAPKREKKYVLKRSVVIKGVLRNAGKEVKRDEVHDFDGRVKAGSIEEVEA